jgi:HSP20 family protein
MFRWNDFDRTFAAMDDMRRQMHAVFGGDDDREQAGLVGFGNVSAWPEVSLWDDGQALVLTANIPGMSDKDIQLSVHQDVLTLSGERSTKVPEGYAVERQERGKARFSRSFALPTRVDAERASADVKDGVLTVTLPKHPDAQPRQIAVKAS